MNRGGRSIVLIGMMGAGKSSVGRCLHERTALALLDTDEIITSQFRLPISDIFLTYGEEKFREAETQALRKISSHQSAIIVTGGGIVLRQENVELLKRLGAVVWLDANEETLFRRASHSGGRPLLQGKNARKTFAQMLQARRPLYAKIADIRVETSALAPHEAAVAIWNKLARYYSPRAGSAFPAAKP
ncbi:MAG: shikimate kinase [Chthoniobacterales bacterium]|jgi:shikimate kinase|nr:shikimate kinase [Chthoniobacterales bacterium]